MDEKLNHLKLSELIDLGQQRLIELQEEQEKNRLQAEEHEKEQQQNFLAAAGECLPAPLRHYLEFRRWHKPDFGLSEGWTAEANLRVPCCNLIRLLYRQGDGDSYHLYTRNLTCPVLVIKHQVEYNEDAGEYILDERIHSRYDDVLLALGVAAELGDDMAELMGKKIDLEKELALREQQQPQADEAGLLEKPSDESELEFTISAAVTMFDKNRLNEASVLSTIAIARALKLGVELWMRQDARNDLSETVRIWGSGE